MEILKINSSKNSPLVQLIMGVNKSTLKIEGSSILEDPKEFYQEIIDSLNKLKGKKIIVTFNFKYLNSASVKCILTLLIKIKLFKSKIIWMYEFEDDDMKETGKDLESIVEIPFEFEEVNL